MASAIRRIQGLGSSKAPDGGSLVFEHMFA